jgi:hypothetical protein
MLWRDARDRWNGNTMPDARVTHFWDGEMQVGEWFAEEVEGYRGVSWDTYFLYGPDGKREAVPTSLIASGGTICAEREALKIQESTLLEK